MKIKSMKTKPMKTKSPYPILVVEDEEDILNLMCLHLSREGYFITKAKTGKSAYNKLSQNHYLLVILDWMLPEISGLELLQWMRKTKHKNTPVLFVTAKSDPEDIVEGLSKGADDYITKPFDFAVFKARVRNLIKRTELAGILENTKNNLLCLGDLTVDISAHKVFIKKKEIMLTLSEFRLLEILLAHQGKALSRAQMISFIQGENINVTGRTIDTHISILRKKLKGYGKFIETVRGIGYRIGFF